MTRHVWADLMDELEHPRHTTLNREIYKKRKQTIEQLFADAKEKQGMRWTKYRGLEKVAFFFQNYTKNREKELI